jgi:hypothetical protein
MEEPVKPETSRGARRVVPRRRRGRTELAGARGEPAIDGRHAADDAAFDPVEFAEFLEADDGPLPADSAFRERLRDELWSMVQSQSDRRRSAPAPVTPLPQPKRPR